MLTMDTIMPPLFFFFQSTSDFLEDDIECIKLEEEEVQYDPAVEEFKRAWCEREFDMESNTWDFFNRIKYGMKIGNWVVIHHYFALYNNTDGPGSIPHLWLLIKLDNLLSKVDSDVDIKNNMSAGNLDAFHSTKEIIVNELELYHRQITTYKKTMKKKKSQPRIRGSEEDSDDEVEMQVYGDKEGEGDMSSHWVTGPLEEKKWESVEVKLRQFYYQKTPPYDINKLSSLIKDASTPAQRVLVLLNVVDAQFTLNEDLCGHIPIKEWRNCVLHMTEVVSILSRNRNILVGNGSTVCGWRFLLKETKKKQGYKGKIRVGDNLIRVFSRICFEFLSIMRLTDSGTKKDGYLLFDLYQNLMEYLQNNEEFGEMACIAVLLMGILYFQTQEEYDLMGLGGSFFPLKCDLMNMVYSLINLNGGSNIKAQAVVFMTYHHAIMDQFEIGEKLLLESGLHLKVQHMDLAFLVYYKESLKQLGLCGFRSGLIKESHTCICDNLYAATLKEEEHRREKTSEMKLRHGEMLPLHKNIDDKLLKAVHMICAMLLDKKSMSKSCLVKHNAEVKSLKSENIIAKSLKSWIHLKGRHRSREMLKKKIQEETFTYASFNFEKLTAMFESDNLPTTSQHCANSMNGE